MVAEVYPNGFCGLSMGVILLHQRRFRETWGVLEIAGGEY